MTLLTSLLRPKYGSGLEIGTVDGMQGREKDAVIISLVRSNDKVCDLGSWLGSQLIASFFAEGSGLPEREAQTEW